VTERVLMNFLSIFIILSFIMLLLYKFLKKNVSANSLKGFETYKKLGDYFKIASRILLESKILFLIPFFSTGISIIFISVQRFLSYFKNNYTDAYNITETTQYIFDQFFLALKNTPNNLYYGYITSMNTSIFLFGLILIIWSLYPFLVKNIRIYFDEECIKNLNLFYFSFSIILIIMTAGSVYNYYISKNLITVSLIVYKIISRVLIVGQSFLFPVAFSLIESFILIYSYFKITKKSFTYKQIIEKSIRIYINFFKFNLILTLISLMFMALNHAIDFYSESNILIPVFSVRFVRIISYFFSVLITVILLPAPFILIINNSNLKTLMINNLDFIKRNLKKYVIFIITGLFFLETCIIEAL